MIELLGVMIFTTVVGIGLLDAKSGLSPFEMYRSTTLAAVGRREPATERPGDGNQPTPPAAAR